MSALVLIYRYCKDASLQIPYKHCSIQGECSLPRHWLPFLCCCLLLIFFPLATAGSGGQEGAIRIKITESKHSLSTVASFSLQQHQSGEWGWGEEKVICN